jgi:hypothetical protein
MDSVSYESSENQLFSHNLVEFRGNDNQVFNHNFVFINKAGDFPAGWHKYTGHKTADFHLEIADKQDFSIKIRNQLFRRFASIAQERSYCISVHEKQLWEVGAILRVNKPLSASIRIHFLSPSRVLYSSLDFILEPGSNYYCGLISVPGGANYALLELGTSDAGSLWIENVVFKRVFPIDKYEMDARGRLNINTVEAVKNIIDPVNIKGRVEVKKESRDISEDVVAGPKKQVSGSQDVLHLLVYSICAINQGNEAALLQLQISPDGINWTDDGLKTRVEAGKMGVCCCNHFLRYIRLVYYTDNQKTTNLRIYFQGQG